ncbi:hypothetical protein D9615_002548 [Tricholomella constricta]|uniref:Uncharacterized protein n=1 Tax=Tricholomella constricta TaxID=117010 RepID=A0A8H5M9P6_9AGAR|nr:hypothetical protein D9615_002548 [Tricholomella constricta]
MRKTSYVVTFFAVALTLVLNILSNTGPDWLVVQTPEVLHTRFIITYGLSKRCERQVTRIPGPNNGKLEYTDYECRHFPLKVTDGCEKENEMFCDAWTSARYLEELAVWCAAASLCAIAFGVSTHSRRRRIWRAVAGLVLLHAAFQLAAFGTVTEMYRTSRFPTFEHARLGPAYFFNILSWLFSVFIGVAVITTGVFADKGHRWAAGNRPYRPIGNA